MTARPWSLANRLSLWFWIATTVPLALAIFVGGLFLERSISADLVALLEEEVMESVEPAREMGDVAQAFEPLSRKLASHHPTIPIAWRFRDTRTGAVMAEYGETAILGDRAAGAVRLGEVTDLGKGRLTKTIRVSDDIALTVALDGSSPLTFLERYRLVAGVILALAAVVALISSRILARKIASLLRGIADRVSAERADRPVAPARTTPPDEIREVADALQRDFHRVRSEAERIKLFTAGMAHELRSPIQNLIGQAEVALMSEHDPSSFRELLSAQLEELSALGDAVDNLLTILTIAPRGDDEQEEFDLAKEVELRLARERARARRGGIHITIQASGNMSMCGDRESALRGIRNVVANAVSWSPPGGCVRISLEGNGEEISVTVEDDGPGVPVGDRPRIFEAFAQGSRKDRERIGYGLGLAIAKAAVEGHGGLIAVGSSPSEGARFRMTFKRGIPA